MSAKRPKTEDAITNYDMSKVHPPSLSPMHNATIPIESQSSFQGPQDKPIANIANKNESRDAASWVGCQVDAIFSPVLSFLQADSDDRGMPAAKKTNQKQCDLEQKGINLAIPDENRRVDETMLDHFKVGVMKDTAPRDNLVSKDLEEVDEDDFNPYLFIKCLPPYQHAIPPEWIHRPKVLPPHNLLPTPPICLVLDLDETLVHCTIEPIANPDMVFPVNFNGAEYQVHVLCRPFLQEFLEAVSSKFEVVIFTASQQVYADKLLDMIDPEGKFIRHRIFRDGCLPVEGNFLKDLSILGRDLSRAVLVDNSPHAFGYQIDNGIPIESWFDDPADKELLKLELFLRTLHSVDDVRDVLRKTFQIHKLVLEA